MVLRVEGGGVGRGRVRAICMSSSCASARTQKAPNDRRVVRRRWLRWARWPMAVGGVGCRWCGGG